MALTDYQTGDTVPAYTGVLVTSTTSGDHIVTLATGGTSKLGNDNMLKATGDGGIKANSMFVANTKFYRLTMHNGTQIGFWWGAADGDSFALGSNKAYLAVPDAAAARIQGFWFDSETNGISNVNRETMANSRYYNLNGQRVNKPTKGLYIKDGKKYLVK